MATEAEIIKQIEYYLSDANLERDEFFHKKISESNDGYVDIELFLKCNKVKKMGISEDDIIKAMANSKEVELKDKQVRRKDNKTLPGLIKKKQKTENNQENKQEQPKQQEEEKIEVKITKPEEPIVFQVAVTVNSASMHWKLLTEILQKSFDIKPIYIRYNKVNSEGNFILDKKTTDQALVDKITSEGIKVGSEFEAKITVCNETELEEFYNLHGSHYDNCIELQALNKTSFNEKRKKIAEKREKRKKNMIIFAGEKFFDISQLKNSFKGILGRTSNNDKIKEPYHEMLVELIKFHDKKDEKLRDLDYFTCDVHPVYNETRCFFVVRKDGTKEDFSFTKCLVKLEEAKKNKEN